MELMSREPIVTTRESTVRTALLMGTVGALVLGGTIASFMLESALLSQVAALLSTFLLLPLALAATIRSYRGARHVLNGAAELDARREELEAEHEEIAARTAEIENRAARVEKQYQILCGLVNERSAAGRPEELEDPDAEGTREALEEALEELRRREASERLLADRIRELESARRRAEQELARLMSESRERLRMEREVSETARERKLARATEDAAESLKVRSAATTEAEELLLEAQARAQALLEEAEAEAAQLAAQGREEFESALRELKIREDEEVEKGGQIIADARIRAAELVTRAEEQAAELVALGEAEFEALLQQISEHEQRERELYERIRRLEQGGSAAPPAPHEPNLRSTLTGQDAGQDAGEDSRSRDAGQDSRSNGSPISAETGRPREGDRDQDQVVPDLVLLVDPPSGPLGALRNLFGGFRSRDRSLDG
jgi:DNA repair exonuclease SbcCD ATPase subunit